VLLPCFLGGAPFFTLEKRRPFSGMDYLPMFSTAAFFRRFVRKKNCSCPYQKLNPDILVVQAAQDRHRQNAATAWRVRGVGASLFSDKCVRA
jgi:hypothetical protein